MIQQFGSGSGWDDVWEKAQNLGTGNGSGWSSLSPGATTAPFASSNPLVSAWASSNLAPDQRKQLVDYFGVNMGALPDDTNQFTTGYDLSAYLSERGDAATRQKLDAIFSQLERRPAQTRTSGRIENGDWTSFLEIQNPYTGHWSEITPYQLQGYDVNGLPVGDPGSWQNLSTYGRGNIHTPQGGGHIINTRFNYSPNEDGSQYFFDGANKYYGDDSNSLADWAPFLMMAAPFAAAVGAGLSGAAGAAGGVGGGAGAVGAGVGAGLGGLSAADVGMAGLFPEGMSAAEFGTMGGASGAGFTGASSGLGSGLTDLGLGSITDAGISGSALTAGPGAAGAGLPGVAGATGTIGNVGLGLGAPSGLWGTEALAAGGAAGLGGGLGSTLSNLSPNQILRGGSLLNSLVGGGGSGGGLGLGDITSLLGGGLDTYNQDKSSKEMLDWLKSRMAINDNLYQPGSTEYNALWDQMSRKDAAAGRNSQYGPRSVDLAAKIAQIKSDANTRMTTGIGNLYKNSLDQKASAPTGLMGALDRIAQGSGLSLSDITKFLTGTGWSPNLTDTVDESLFQPEDGDLGQYF